MSKPQDIQQCYTNKQMNDTSEMRKEAEYLRKRRTLGIQKERKKTRRHHNMIIAKYVKKKKKKKKNKEESEKNVKR